MSKNNTSAGASKNANAQTVIQKLMQTPLYCNVIERQMQEDIARKNQQQNFVNSIRQHNAPFNSLINAQRRVPGNPGTADKYKNPKLMHTHTRTASAVTPPEFSKQMQDIINTSNQADAKQPHRMGTDSSSSRGRETKHGSSTRKEVNKAPVIVINSSSDSSESEKDTSNQYPPLFVTIKGNGKGKDGLHESKMSLNSNHGGSESRSVSDSSVTSTESTAKSTSQNRPSSQQRQFAHPKRHANEKFKRQSYPVNNELSFKQDRRSSLGSFPATAADRAMSLKRRHYSEATPSLHEEISQKKFRRGSPQLQGRGCDDPQYSPGSRYFETPFTVTTLSEEIYTESQKNQQTAAILDKKMKLRQALEDVIRCNFPGCSLHLVGSSTNGLGNAESDADFCLMLTTWREIDQRGEARRILMQLNYILRYCSYVHTSYVIFATVPIVKFIDAVSNCECDININNHVGIRNTYLLRAYCAVDSRVKPLILIMKKWAKRHGINEPKDGTLSSYALSLMVINYLQCGCTPPVVPSLQMKCPDLFVDQRDVTKLLDEDTTSILQQRGFLRSSNKQTVGELLVGFFQYYADNVKWDVDLLSVRQGARCQREFKWKHKSMCIEEPFDGNNVAKTVYNAAKFDKIKMKINLAAHTLKVSPSLQSIL